MNDIDPELRDVAARLEAERPLPRPAFRGELRRHLMAHRPSTAGRMRLAVGQLGGGFALLVLAAAGVLGLGPLAY
jgi:hypothetical protein